MTTEATFRFFRTAGLAAVAALLVAPPAGVDAQSPDPQAMAEGARLYGQTCGRCHNPRPATERTDREWLTVVNHMRVRANLTRSQAEAILAFMKATNGVGGTGLAAAPGPASEAGDAVTPEEMEARLADLELRLLGMSADRVSTLTPEEKTRLLEYLRELREGDRTSAATRKVSSDGTDDPR